MKIRATRPWLDREAEVMEKRSFNRAAVIRPHIGHTQYRYEEPPVSKPPLKENASLGDVVEQKKDSLFERCSDAAQTLKAFQDSWIFIAQEKGSDPSLFEDVEEIYLRRDWRGRTRVILRCGTNTKYESLNSLIETWHTTGLLPVCDVDLEAFKSNH